MHQLRHNKTYHKTHFMSGTNCYILQQHGAILRELKTTNIRKNKSCSSSSRSSSNSSIFNCSSNTYCCYILQQHDAIFRKLKTTNIHKSKTCRTSRSSSTSSRSSSRRSRSSNSNSNSSNCNCSSSTYCSCSSRDLLQLNLELWNMKSLIILSVYNRNSLLLFRIVLPVCILVPLCNVTLHFCRYDCWQLQWQ